MTQSRLSEAVDHRVDPEQFGFRKAHSIAQPVHIYRILQETHVEARLELLTVLLDWAGKGFRQDKPG